MEERIIKEIEKFDNQLIKDYTNKIRTEIFNGIEDLRKRNDVIHEMLDNEENKLFNSINYNFNNINVYNSEEVKKLTKLIKIYNYLIELFDNRWRNKSLNNLKSLIKD